MSQLVSIGKASEILGVSVDTLRIWDRENKLSPVKTLGNHRRYKMEDIEALCGKKTDKPESKLVRVACYSRVSSHEQKAKGDLERQAGRILTYCAEKEYHVVKTYEEVGSGMCDSRAKLQQLFRLISERKIDRVVVEHKDRLTRFNFNFLSQFFASHGVEIEWVSEVLGKSYEEELVEDMLTLMSSFSNRIYGKRSAENRKKKKELEAYQTGAK